MSGQKVYAGADAPDALRGRVMRGDPALDLTTVTAVTIAVARADKSTATWACSITSATESLITFSHTFAAAETAGVFGRYGLVAHLTVSGGIVRSVLTPLNVVDPSA